MVISKLQDRKADKFKDWEIKSLLDLVNYTNGKAHEQCISDSGQYIVVNSKFISTEGQIRKYSNAQLCAAVRNDILMVMSDVPNGRAIAKCYWVEKDNAYTVNQRICILSPKKVDGKFLYYKLNRNKYFLSFDDGAKQTNLRKDEVLKCPLWIPKNLAEQKAISIALSDVDSLIDSLEELIEKKRNFKLATMQELLTGKTRLPGFADEWEEKKLGEILIIRHGKNQSKVEDENGLYPILASGGQIGKSSLPLYDKPSVLIGRKGTINRPRYIDIPFWTVDTLFYSEMKNGNIAKFFYYRFLLIDWMKYNEASGVPSLNAKTIESIEIICPKPTEQNAISSVLSDLDFEIEALQQQLSKTKNLKIGMLQELLTGKTRLVDI